VDFLKVGSLASVPFNIHCGRCRCCKERNTGVCLNVNPARSIRLGRHERLGRRKSGTCGRPPSRLQSTRRPDGNTTMVKINNLTLLSDIFPTGYHDALSAGVGPGSISYIAGADPFRLASTASFQILRAACVMVSDMIPERLEQAKKCGPCKI